MATPNDTAAPWTREKVERLEGCVLVEFGASWCGWCRQAAPWIGAALQTQPRVRHIRIEDARGEPLGRSFGVTLWPTLVVLRDGHEVDRLVRPASAAAIADALGRCVA